VKSAGVQDFVICSFISRLGYIYRDAGESVQLGIDPINCRMAGEASIDGYDSTGMPPISPTTRRTPFMATPETSRSTLGVYPGHFAKFLYAQVSDFIRGPSGPGVGDRECSVLGGGLQRSCSARHLTPATSRPRPCPCPSTGSHSPPHPPSPPPSQAMLALRESPAPPRVHGAAAQPP
jgi:hypothetical protein